MSEPNSAFEGLVYEFACACVTASERYGTGVRRDAARQRLIDAYTGVVAERNAATRSIDTQADLFGEKLDKSEADLAAAQAKIEQIANERDAAEEALAELRAKEVDLATTKAYLKTMLVEYGRCFEEDCGCPSSEIARAMGFGGELSADVTMCAFRKLGQELTAAKADNERLREAIRTVKPKLWEGDHCVFCDLRSNMHKPDCIWLQVQKPEEGK